LRVLIPNYRPISSHFSIRIFFLSSLEKCWNRLIFNVYRRVILVR
jgi:hypothetical protein